MIVWHNVRLRDTSGKISGIISVGVDITDMENEREKLENSLAEARAIIDKLEQERP